MHSKPMGQRLPLKERPRDFENIQSYISRLSALNIYERPRWIYQMLEADCSDFSYAMLETALSGLPSLAGVSENHIAAIAYRSSGSDNHNTIQIGNRGSVASSLMDIKHPRVCPGCVSEYGAALALWDFKFYQACSFHRCRLIDRCTNPDCGTKLTWWRPQLGSCAACEQPLHVVRENTVADLVTLGFSAMLERLWGTPFSVDVPNIGGGWDTAGFTETLDSIRMITARLTTSLEADKQSSHFSLQALSEIVAKAFYDWPKGFFDYVDALIELDVKEGRAFSIKNTSRLGSLFGRVMEGTEYPYYDRMKTALLEFIHESRFGAQVTGKGGGRLNMVPAHQKQFMTRTEVMKELGISAPTFKRAFANGDLIGEVLQMGRQHVYRVRRSSVEKYPRKQH